MIPGVRLFRSLLFQVALWAILPLLAITAVSVVSIYGHQQAERDLVADRVARLAHVVSGSITSELEDRVRLLQALGENSFSASDEALQNAFDRGVVRLSARGETLDAFGDAATWADQPAISELQRRARAGNGAAVMAFSAGDQASALAVVAAPEANGGTLLGAFSAAGLTIDHLLDDLQLGARGSAFVVDPAGSILYARGPQPPGQEGARLPGIGQARAGESGAQFTESEGELWAVGYASVPLGGWSVIVRESWADAVGPMARFSVLTPVLVILAALVSLVAVYLIVTYVIRPLGTLGSMAERVAWGDFTAVDHPVSGAQEIRDLHGTLRHTVDQIRRYQAGMQSYVTAVTQGQEEERRRLARELHDDTAQALVGLLQRIKLARRDLKRDPAHVEARLMELEQLATAAWQDVRRFSEALRPAYLEQFGLEPALRTLCEQADTLSTAPKCSFAVEGAVRRISSEVEVALFRIAQEALNNARQHADAQRVAVTLKYDETRVVVTVSDDGRGFDPPRSPAELAASGHFGLAGIRERALLIGGQLDVNAAPRRGTRIEVAVPTNDLHITVT